ncbi:hypothetical protein NG791_20690 [Laspinema sp. D1]|uniref:hypothetical protein n=1 Tax=Laspinema palackyanum TaxID=3231601 RepID=UPI0034890F22|nr:hypothetical protein [Laspinema sp. D2b]
MKWFSLIFILPIVAVIGFLVSGVEVVLPATPPSEAMTYTPMTQPAPPGIGSYDVLGHPVSKEEADRLLQTEAGRDYLSPENGAIEITDELIDLGRKNFYTETFGNEVIFTDVVGILDGPINIASMTKAILALKGQPTTNLQIPLKEDITVGGQTFKAGTMLNTGLDVPKGSVLPLGLSNHLSGTKVRVGVTCALCHAAIDGKTGAILEGATNNDIDAGLLLAMASNTAALYRQTGVNPLELPKGSHTYLNSQGELAKLPDSESFEEAVDQVFLSWAPGNFDSSGDQIDNPSQIPPSYTHDAWPYSWSGGSSIGWFHGLSSLNSRVFAFNADPTTTAENSEKLYGIDKETFLGAIFQNSSNSKFRLPEGAKPSEFFARVNPTPDSPGFDQTIKMPEYPNASLFAANGLMLATPALPVGTAANAMSAWQNTLAPPPNEFLSDSEAVQRGAVIFNQAGCVDCHSGRYFTNHEVIPQREVGTQPERAKASLGLKKLFQDPTTYPPSVQVPLPENPPVIPVPTDITPQRSIDVTFGITEPKGGYKVQHLIGLYLTAPYLHDGGVAAAADGLRQDADGKFAIANPDRIGLPGTLLQGINPDPEASLRMLVDRRLREAMIASNRANPSLKRANIDGRGHDYWVDEEAGFTPGDQSDLIQFLLSIDDDPEVLPEPKLAQGL